MRPLATKAAARRGGGEVKKPLRKCGNCKHGGIHFKLPHLGTHLHCEHPHEAISGEPGWGTLRGWYDKCDHWQPRQPRGGEGEKPTRSPWECNLCGNELSPEEFGGNCGKCNAPQGGEVEK